MRILVIAMLLHAVLASLLPMPWLVPDLTLLGMVIATARAPHRWLVYAGVAGCGMMLWAARLPAPILLSYVVVGGAVRLAATRWDLADRVVQRVLVGAATLGVSLAWLWLDDVWSCSLVAWVLGRALVTGLLVTQVSR